MQIQVDVITQLKNGMAAVNLKGGFSYRLKLAVAFICVASALNLGTVLWEYCAGVDPIFVRLIQFIWFLYSFGKVEL